MNSCDVFSSGLYHDPSPLQAFFPMAFPLRHGLMTTGGVFCFVRGGMNRIMRFGFWT